MPSTAVQNSVPQSTPDRSSAESDSFWLLNSEDGSDILRNERHGRVLSGQRSGAKWSNILLRYSESNSIYIVVQSRKGKTLQKRDFVVD